MGDGNETDVDTEGGGDEIETRRSGKGREDPGDRDSLLADLRAEQAKAGKGRGKKPGGDEDADLEDDDDDDETFGDEDDDEAQKAGDAEDDKVEEDEEEDDDKERKAKDEDDEEDVELDADTKKKMAALQKAEKRVKEQLAADREKLERLVREWEPRVAAAQKFEQLAARAKYAPAEVLEALGLSPDDDFEAAARELYARSKAGAKDPKLRDAAGRLQRERERDELLARTSKELAELKQQLEVQKSATATESAVNEYLDRVEKAAAKVEAPLVKHMIAKTPKKARARMLEVANQLSDEMGEVPTAADVIAELEKRRRQELEEDGIDPKKVLEISPTTEGGGKGKKAAKTLAKTGGGSGGSGGPAKPKTRDEEFEDLKAELKSRKMQGT